MAKKEKNCRLGKVGGQAVLEGVMMRSGDEVSPAVRKEDGTIVRSVHDVKPKEPIAVRVSDGTIVATVIGGKPNE